MLNNPVVLAVSKWLPKYWGLRGLILGLVNVFKGSNAPFICLFIYFLFVMGGAEIQNNSASRE